MYIYNNGCNMTEQYKIVIFQYHWYSVYNNSFFYYYYFYKWQWWASAHDKNAI